MAAGCKIIKEFCRPEKDLVMRFKDMPVANIDDNMGRVAAVDNSICQWEKDSFLVPRLQ